MHIFKNGCLVAVRCNMHMDGRGQPRGSMGMRQGSGVNRDNNGRNVIDVIVFDIKLA